MVRGVEGAPDTPPVFYGQPNANVRAAANLDLDPATLSGDLSLRCFRRC